MKSVSFDAWVPSDRNPARGYQVRGQLSCDCQGFATHGRCKHLRRFLEEMLRSHDTGMYRSQRKTGPPVR